MMKLSSLMQRQPARPRSLQRGFATGIVISLAVSGCVLAGVHWTNAQGMTDAQPAATTAVAVVSDSPTSNPSTAGHFSDQTASSSSASPSTVTTTTTTAPTNPVTAPVAVAAGGNYVAMGDSVAAGLGLPSADECGRSSQAYAYQVAAAVNKPLLHVACSGATVGDLVTKQGVSGPNITSQLDQAYANGNKPSLLSITAGANDIQWSTFVQKCYVATCGTGFDPGVLNASLLAMQAKLYYALYDIQLRTAGSTPPRVIITGYYNPVSSQCAAVSQGKLTNEEINWVTNSVASLNQKLQTVANQFSFARFAPVNFSGHDLCSGSSWIQSQTDPAALHPTAEGQKAIAQSVIAASR